MRTLQTKVPEYLYREVEELVKLGLFRNNSEVLRAALKKTLAEQSREYLRDLVERMGIIEKEMLKTLKEVRE